MPESAPGTIGHITLEVKLAGERCAGKPHAPFDEAGAGNGGTVSGPQRLQRSAWTAPDLFGHRASSRPYPPGGRRGDLPSLPDHQTFRTMSAVGMREGSAET